MFNEVTHITSTFSKINKFGDDIFKHLNLSANQLRLPSTTSRNISPRADTAAQHDPASPADPICLAEHAAGHPTGRK